MRVATLLLCGLLTGCMGNYIPPTGDTRQARYDSFRCEKDAINASGGTFVYGSYVKAGPDPFFYNRCMEAMGYTKQ